ncbi:MAG: hypothetical protein A2942_04430 [Candidatus Lloydbacteria bacterium RIFCSPLOWO2_01_FULL_50_20]|uniref:Uncharacterized protein n=1 Tax=Candidatus Lloydbacteria bacterium RIFCSPLOWO2_01_FULL_50_20 TaxID=1798665 RepID=A0A1G2DCV7_9BACT|nr:MAG: hypothetical protein A2942_04430 [Candidatus Lloydbacteria bacterium RIFCSPLOWO2_01_FULL_50_20]
MVRENFMRSLSVGFIKKYAGHPSVIALTDLKRWKTRFEEMVEGFTPEEKIHTLRMIATFIQYWDTLSKKERSIAAHEIAVALIAKQRATNVLKEMAADPNAYLPVSTTLQ